MQLLAQTFSIGWKNYRDERNLTGIVLAIFLEATKGKPVDVRAGELMASFVSQNCDLALRDTRTIEAVAVLRRTNASGGLVSSIDAGHLLVS